MTFEEPDDLILRIMNAPIETRHVFMLGSGLSLPDGAIRGVPGVAALVNQIRQGLTPSEDKTLASRLDQPEANVYQETMGLLERTRGKEAVNGIIRMAVLDAMINREATFSASPFEVIDKDDFQCEIEDIISAWPVSRGLQAVGNLISYLGRQFGETVLTTNFDPLIGIAIRKADGHYFRLCVPTDGDLRPNGGSVTRVVHLHGYWRDSDTLHTLSALTASRPLLEDSLKALLLNKTLLVIGYGGWDDVLMRCLSEICTEPQANTEIVWCFREDSKEVIEGRYAHVLKALAPAVHSGRVTLIQAFDANMHLPKLWDRIFERELFNRLTLRKFIERNFGVPAQGYEAIDEQCQLHFDINLEQYVTKLWRLEKEKVWRIKDLRIDLALQQQIDWLYARWVRAAYGPAVNVELPDHEFRY